MIDVLLVLIIIFMVITPIAPTGLNTLLPQTPDAESPQPAVTDDLVITVQEDGSVRLNSQPLGLSELSERLKQLSKIRASHLVFVRGDKNLDFEQVAEVIDIAKGAGMDRIGLMTQ
jgi:biopolymer transport protein ExbD